MGCGLGGVGKGLFAIPFKLIVRGGCCLVGVKCRFGCITTVTMCGVGKIQECRCAVVA